MPKVTKRRVKNGVKELKRITRSMRGKDRVKVGFPKGTESTILDRAVYNEFGTATIPERPFMRDGLRDGIPELKQVNKGLVKRIIDGRLTKQQALNQLGMKGVQLIQNSITGLKDPANAPSTIERKGSSNPLIDTGEMRQSVTHKVE